MGILLSTRPWHLGKGYSKPKSVSSRADSSRIKSASHSAGDFLSLNPSYCGLLFPSLLEEDPEVPVLQSSSHKCHTRSSMGYQFFPRQSELGPLAFTKWETHTSIKKDLAGVSEWPVSDRRHTYTEQRQGIKKQ